MLLSLISPPRWYYLLRHHRLKQFAERARGVVRRRWRSKFGVTGYSQSCSVQTREQVAVAFDAMLDHKLAERRTRGAVERASQIRQRRFCFLNEMVEFGEQIDWRLDEHPELDALWKFHLHYQEYLLDLAASEDERPSSEVNSTAWGLVEEWIQGNPISSKRVFGDAWHPFCISRRLPVWMLLWTAGPPTAKLQPLVLNSLTNQANFLADNLEVDLGGNHLLENLHALGMAGCFVEGKDAERWLDIVERKFAQELPEQLTVHGEHFERSPMYHSFMLEIMLNLHETAESVRPSLAATCASAAAKMAAFLGEIIHPDGEIPLFGDSAFGQAPSAADLLGRAGVGDATERGRSSSDHVSRSGGYWSYRDGGDFLVFDAEVGFPDHLPAHGHSDLLGFEVSVDGQRLFVDSGVCTYGEGEMREYCRSTAAHNSLEIDGQSQMDMWSRFRVGYRGWPTKLETGNTDGFRWAKATHNAYRRVGVPIVGRWIACHPGGPWLCVDWACGDGEHQLAQRLHLHPDFQIEPNGDSVFRVATNGKVWELRMLGAASTVIEEGWYCPEFGKQLSNSVIASRAQMPATTALAWVLCWPGQTGRADLQQDESGELAITWDGSVKLRHVLAT